MPATDSQPSQFRHFLALGGHFLGHIVAVALGFVLMIVGLAMGVTMVLLPVGIVVGLLGVALLVSGMFARVTPPA
jgi:hypothetical protein